ncbi:hypothetical protein RRG08_040965 [Elysia crispata]|uniref:Cysteine sulfinic acid decarboxylase n=1 Tax=Elysia crispata TaxID=231223 RepID=A0AAE1AM22_9GAST|nr:hypothetical protein RRG08_040965 [Elysia crispata]
MSLDRQQRLWTTTCHQQFSTIFSLLRLKNLTGQKKLFQLYQVPLYRPIKMASTSFHDPEVVKFLDKAFEIIKEESLQKGTDNKYPVVDFQQPKDLESLLDTEISSEPATHDQLLDALKKIIQYSVKTGHPHFMNQLYGGLDPYSQVGAWVTPTLNTNLHTYEVAPAFVILERYIYKKMLALVGFEHGEGLFCPGGTASNIFALHLARFNKFPDVRKNGIYGMKPLRMYTSDMAHYSLKKGALYLGLGTDNVVTINTDDRGHMITSELERCIKEDLEKGFVPMYVNATSGSTVLGSFDDLTAISEVCKTYNLWLHSDACWGGGTLLSRKHRHLMKGSHLCNSIAWNFHKFSGTPIQSSAFLLNDPSGNLMEEANSTKAEYLFQPDKYYDASYDIGDKTVQCGRSVDIVKLWMQWRGLGDSGMEAKIDLAYDKAHYLTEKLKITEGFKMVLPEFECTNISFWYIPKRLRGKVEDDGWWQEVNDVAPKLKERMMKAGTLMIQYQALSTKGYANFFRVVIVNQHVNYSDMDFVIEEFERLGHDL